MGQSLGFPCFHKVHKPGWVITPSPTHSLTLPIPGSPTPPGILSCPYTWSCASQIMPRRNQAKVELDVEAGRPRGRGGRINPVPRALNRDRSRSPPLLVRVPQDSDSSSGTIRFSNCQHQLQHQLQHLLPHLNLCLMIFNKP